MEELVAFLKSTGNARGSAPSASPTTNLRVIRSRRTSFPSHITDLVASVNVTINQTGQAIEIVSIWLVVYLSISIVTSLFMNWFNAKMALVER